MHVLFYWLARAALMFAVFVALWGVGWKPWFAVVGATVVAWLISYAMFGSMHDAAARQMERWVSRRFVSVAGDAEAKVEGAPNLGATPRAASPAKPRAASPARPKPQPKVAARRSS
ncbi:MAG TPA: DUF4229 domain-containing protein [Demequinaceae bacterium]